MTGSTRMVLVRSAVGRRCLAAGGGRRRERRTGRQLGDIVSLQIRWEWTLRREVPSAAGRDDAAVDSGAG
jgi:hypothetical protein